MTTKADDNGDHRGEPVASMREGAAVREAPEHTTRCGAEHTEGRCSGPRVPSDGETGVDQGAIEALLERVSDLQSRIVQLLGPVIAVAPWGDTTAEGPSQVAIDAASSHLHGAVLGFRKPCDTPEGVDLDPLRSALHDVFAHRSARLASEEPSDPEESWPSFLDPRLRDEADLL